MGFFDQRPVATPPAEPSRPAWMRPETVLPGVAPDTFLLARTEDAVVALGDLLCYPNGFGFTVTAIVRKPLRPGRTAASGAFRRHTGPGPVPDDFLRFGMRWPDGTILTNLDPARPGPEEPGPCLLPESGNGGTLRYEQSYWAWPLPPPGRLDMVCEWPARGIAETTAELDVNIIIGTAQRAIAVF